MTPPPEPGIRTGPALWWIVFLCGIAWRALHVLLLHPPTSYIYSDMAWYARDAVEWFRPGYVGGIADALHPPGNRWFLGLLHLADPSWRLAVLAQLLLSSCVAPLLWGIGRETHGGAVAGLSMAMASLYFPFIDYAGYFLAENQYLFILLAAMWLILRALRAESARSAALIAAASGLAWGAAGAMKEVGLASAAAVFGVLAFAGILRRRRFAGACAAGMLAGLLPVVSMLGIRCTRLNGGRRCLISTQAGVGFLSGHCGEVGWIFFKNTFAGELGFRGWKTPSSEQRGYSRNLELPFNSYDTRECFAYGLKWTREHPLESLRLSALHVWDLFFAPPFPSGFLYPWSKATRLFQCAFWVFVLLPVCVRARRRARSVLRLEGDGPEEALLLAPMAALVAVVVLTSGEFRYRLPLDGFLIVLAAAEFAERFGLAAGPQGTTRLAPR